MQNKNGLTWQIGDVKIQQVLEVDTVGPAIQQAIPLAKPEQVKEIPWLYPQFADENGVLKSSNQSFIIKSGKSVIVVDTADGEGKIRSDLPEWSDFHTAYLERFAATGTTLEEVDFVISTHLHTDHEGFNTIVRGEAFVPTFPNAKYLFVQKDYDYWVAKPEKEMAADKEAFDDSVAPILQAGLGEMVPASYRIDENVYLLPTPGHTPGHVAVVIESKGEKAILSGDVIHHPCQIANPHWTMLADVDSQIALQTRINLLNSIVNTSTLLLGTHFANPVAGKVVSSKSEKSSFIFTTE